MGGVVSRGIVTWVELVVVGFAGAAVGGVTSGPPELVVYLATTLTSVVVLLYNVARLVDARVADARQTATAGADTDGATDTPGADTDGATDTPGGNTDGATDTPGADTDGATDTPGADTDGATDTPGGNTDGATGTRGDGVV